MQVARPSVSSTPTAFEALPIGDGVRVVRPGPLEHRIETTAAVVSILMVRPAHKKILTTIMSMAIPNTPTSTTSGTSTTPTTNRRNLIPEMADVLATK